MIMYGGQKQETENKLKTVGDALALSGRQAEALAREAFAAALEKDFESAEAKLAEARELLLAQEEGLEWASKHLRYFGRYDATKQFVLGVPVYECARSLVELTAQNIAMLKLRG